VKLPRKSEIAVIESPRQLLSYKNRFDIIFVRFNNYFYNNYSILSTLKHLNRNENLHYFKLNKSFLEIVATYIITLIIIFKKINVTVGDKNTFLVRLNYIKIFLSKITYIDDGNPCVFDGKLYLKNEIIHSSFANILEIKAKKIQYNINYQISSQINVNYVGIIGNNLSEFGINSLGIKKYAELIKSYKNKNYKLIYYKHRMEKSLPNILNAEDFEEIKESRLPLELYFMKEKIIPGTIISVGSSLLTSLNMLKFKGDIIGIDCGKFIEKGSIYYSYAKYFYYLKKGNYCKIVKL
jgi:hypothetical protein